VYVRGAADLAGVIVPELPETAAAPTMNAAVGPGSEFFYLFATSFFYRYGVYSRLTLTVSLVKLVSVA
jgi:hypothetical protein